MENLSLTAVVISILSVLLVSRIVTVFRMLSSTTSLPRVWTWAPPFAIVNVFFPKSMRFDADQFFDSKFSLYLAKKYSAFFAFTPFFGPPTILLADAGAIKQVGQDPVVFGKCLEFYQIVCLWGPNLIATEHEQWRRYRKLLAPTFSEANNRLVWNQGLQICEEWFEYIDRTSTAGVTDDLEIVLNCKRLATMVIARAAFGKRIPWKEDEDGKVGKNGHTMSFGVALQSLMEDFILRFFLPKWGYKLPVKRIQRCALSYKELEQHMREMIDERREAMAAGEETADVFSVLLRESDKEEGEGRLSEPELLSNTFLLMLAGQESTGHTLATALFMLALYPETQEKIYVEAKQHISDEAPGYNNLSSLIWSTATINETLRLFPPIVSIPKRATADTTLTVHKLPNKPGEAPTPIQCFVPAGTNVRLEATTLHHNPLYWEDSTRFNPERFIDTAEKKWNRDAFIAFGVGSRSCLGKTFALVEATIVLSKILLHYQIEVPTSLADVYANRPDESEDQRVRRLHNGQIGVTLTPAKLGVSFVRRKV